MSSGTLEIIINNIKYSGTFVDGVLVEGIIEDKNAIYNGRFSNYVLHGDNCSYYKKNHQTQYIGKFINGYLTEGVTINKGILLEKGAYYDNGVNKYLTSGITYKDYILSGSYNLGCFHIGTANYKDQIIYDGIFSALRDMEQGTIYYKYINMKTNIKLLYDFNYKGCILQKCETEYKGSLTNLNKKQIVLVLCSGINATKAHTFYLNFMRFMNINDIKNLRNIIDVSNMCTSHQEGYELILSNLAKLDKEYTEKKEESINMIEDGIANKYLYLAV